jgi:hypothetical protein
MFYMAVNYISLSKGKTYIKLVQNFSAEKII